MHSHPQRLMTLPALLLCGLSAHVHAQTVVLDSFGPGDAVDGWPSLLYQSASGRQDVAIPFTLTSATSIQSILTSIDGLGGVTLGILARQGAVPTGAAWLYSSHLANPTANSLLTPTGWTLAAGTYWLAAVADNGFSGSWQSGTDDYTANWAYTNSAGAWQEVTTQFTGLPAARITVTAVPEPASFGLLGAGVLLVAAASRRKTARQANASQQG